MVDRNLIEGALRPVTVSQTVAHYTAMGTVAYLVKPGATGLGSAWATPVQFLNDRLELSLGLQILSDQADKYKSSTVIRTLLYSLQNDPGRLATDAFQMSFSYQHDDLGQWRGYGDDGLGCAVVTRAADLRNVADVAGRVVYQSPKQLAFAHKVLDGLRGQTVVADIEQTLVAAACFMKDPGFEPEQEFRVVCFAGSRQVDFRAVGNRLVPYIDFLAGQTALPELLQVIVGPAWQLRQLEVPVQSRHHVMLGIRRLLEARGLSSVPVDISNIPFDPR